MISVAGFSQTGNDTTKYTYYKFTYGEKFNRGWFLNVLDIPTDTVYSKYGVARKGTTIYVGNGTRWTAQGGLGIDGTLAIGNTSNNKSLTMLDSVAQALIQVDPPDEFISIGGYNSSGQQSGVVIDGLGGQVGLSASNGINIGSPVPGSSALFTLRQRVDQGPFNTNLYWPKLNKVAGDTIATLQDVRVAGNLDAVLGLGDTAYQKDMILSWDSQSASFSAGFARRFFDVHPDSLTGVFDVGDVDGHGTALFVFMGGRSVGVRADSGFQIGSFGDSRFTQIRNQAALAGSGFVAKFYLPATGNPVDTAATLFDIRAAGGGTFTPTSSSSTITIAGSNFEVTRPNLRPTSTVSAPTTFSLVAGDLIDFIWIDPASAETIQVGTTPTGSDIIPSTALLASSKNNFLVGYRATASTTLYFQGISSSTVITLIKRQ